MRILIVIALFAAGCASAGAPNPQPVHEALLNPDDVIAAERAFAARAGEIGWIPAFCEYSAADGQLVGRAGLVNAHDRMCALPDDGERNLYWAPNFAGIATSGDLGFTTGPASFDVARTPSIQYFTVWRREADGSWKWIYDGGPGPVAAPGPYVETPQALPTAPGGVGAEAARRQVETIENGFRNTTQVATYLAENAHVYRPGQPRAIGGMQAIGAMISGSSDATYQVRRIESSMAGDMVFTLGEARWTGEGGAQQGFFARIWQYRPEGWQIVYDQLAPWAPPAD